MFEQLRQKQLTAPSQVHLRQRAVQFSSAVIVKAPWLTEEEVNAVYLYDSHIQHHHAFLLLWQETEMEGFKLFVPEIHRLLCKWHVSVVILKP